MTGYSYVFASRDITALLCSECKDKLRIKERWSVYGRAMYNAYLKGLENTVIKHVDGWVVIKCLSGDGAVVYIDN